MTVPGALAYLPADIDTPDGHLDDRYGAFLEAAVMAAPLPDFGVRGEPYPALGALVLDAGATRSLVRATERLARVFARATDAAVSEPGALERFGFPSSFIAMARREAPGVLPVLGRFDFVRDPKPWPGGDDSTGAWRAVEFNADTPSGLREVVSLEPLVRRHLPQTLAGHLPMATGVARRIGSAVAKAIGAPLPGGRAIATVGVVADPAYLEDACQAIAFARAITPTVARRGVHVTFGAVANLHRRGHRAWLRDAPIDALYRHAAIEAWPGTEAWDAMAVATDAGELRLVNGLRGVVAQNKGLMAWIWGRRDDAATFDADARAAIRTYLPPTTWVEAIPPVPVRPGLVVKQAFGREGAEVAMGTDLDEVGWDTCVRWGSYVAQARVPSVPSVAPLPTARGHVVTQAWPVVGGMVSGGRWAGAYARLGGRVTRHDARWCAVLSPDRATRSAHAPIRTGA
ncbi:MAG: glutathionylspermidine synthase family protein [Chloroflexi bacterium]|nr:glutathionylspermidine synthase family protein [Chloroflexota bacterium]